MPPFATRPPGDPAKTPRNRLTPTSKNNCVRLAQIPCYPVRIARISQAPAAQGGPALFQLVRFWSRRWLRDDHLDPDDHALDILVLEAADAGSHRHRATVADIAAQLGIDRSGASRLIASAEAHGYVLRRTHKRDARRVELSITRRGRALINAARRWQSATFLDLVADWDPDDATAFANYLQRLSASVLSPSFQESCRDH